MKTYFAKSIGVDPENICTISVMPCTAKKGECNMELFYEEYAGHDVDLVLTTRELTRMICSAHIDPSTLKDEVCDELMQDGSGAGVIFGATGGVMEAALRSAYFLVTGKNPDADAFKNVRRTREDEFTMTAEIPIGDITVRTAVVSGLANTRRLIERIEREEVHFDFVEVTRRVRAAVSAEADSRSMTAKNWRLHEVKTFTFWMRPMNCGSHMKIRIYKNYMTTLWRLRFLIKHICFSIPTITRGRCRSGNSQFR